MNLSIREIAIAASGRLYGTSDIIRIKEIVTDSRLVNEDSLFVALRGENFDGHDFIDDVIKKGCKVILSEKEMPYNENIVIIEVADTKKALGDIARYYLLSKDVKKVAVTGSVGKTTTKEMIASVCENISDTLKTLGNFNNDIGLPLTAFRMENEKIGIFEMGMSHFGEIEYLSSIVHPDIAVISNIGYSHIENLGSREGILKAKLEILKSLKPGGTIILNGDDKMLWEAKDAISENKIYVGIKNENSDFSATNITETDSSTTFDFAGETYKINVVGIHNVYNAMCAITVGKLLGAEYERIKEGLIKYKPDGIRQNIIEKDGVKIVADCYNAAPDSMVAALDVLKKISAERRIVVFGSVAELGAIRDELLYEVGCKMKDYNVDELITVTEDALSINKGARDSGFDKEKNLSDNKEALAYLKSILKEGDAVLIKGSRKYKMEEISEGLTVN